MITSTIWLLSRDHLDDLVLKLRKIVIFNTKRVNIHLFSEKYLLSDYHMPDRFLGTEDVAPN